MLIFSVSTSLIIEILHIQHIYIIYVCVCIYIYTYACAYVYLDTNTWHSWSSLMPWMVKNLPAMQDTQDWSLGQEDPLKKVMAIHSSTLAWRIPSTGKPGGLQFMGSQNVGHDWVTNTFTFTFIKINDNIKLLNNHTWQDKWIFFFP